MRKTYITLFLLLLLIFLSGCVRTDTKNQTTEHGDLYEVEEWEEQVVAYQEATTPEGMVVKEPIIMTIYKRRTLTRTHDLTRRSEGQKNVSSPMMNGMISKGLNAVVPGVGSLFDKLSGKGGGTAGLFGGSGWSEELIATGMTLWAGERFMAKNRRANAPGQPMPVPTQPQYLVVREDKKIKPEIDDG